MVMLVLPRTDSAQEWSAFFADFRNACNSLDIGYGQAVEVRSGMGKVATIAEHAHE